LLDASDADRSAAALDSLGRPSAARRHAPLPVAIGLAAALTVGLLLPELSSIFHFLRSKRPLPDIPGWTRTGDDEHEVLL
jgi:hypothetical protein